jgi:cell division protein FtsN
VIAPPGAEGKYDFYQMLPKFEVVVPEKERGTRVAPAATIDRPGIYFLQVGSYRDEAVADRIHAQLAKLGIDSTVQRVAVDADVWHRVRIGPIKDLPRLNRLRQQLSASDLDSLVIRVDE